MLAHESYGRRTTDVAVCERALTLHMGNKKQVHLLVCKKKNVHLKQVKSKFKELEGLNNISCLFLIYRMTLNEADSFLRIQ
jgi:hypothetical protein